MFRVAVRLVSRRRTRRGPPVRRSRTLAGVVRGGTLRGDTGLAHGDPAPSRGALSAAGIAGLQ